MASNNEGFTFEDVVPALFVLQFYTNPDVEDFEVEINKDETFQFEDVVIRVTTKNGDTFNFAIQLKHVAGKDQNLYTANFTDGKKTGELNEFKGPFVLNMYAKTSFCSDFIESCSVESCKLLHRSLDGTRIESKYHFILYTNKTFVSNNMEKLKEFTMSKDDTHQAGQLFKFDTSTKSSGECNIYKFGVNDSTQETKNVKKEDYSLLFKQFSLYTSQKNAKKTEKTIKIMFSDIFKSDRFKDYITFFRYCHSNFYTDRKITKNIIRIQLTNLLLEPQILSIRDKSLDLFEEAIEKFEIVVINESYEEFSEAYCVKKCLNKTNIADSDLCHLGKSLKIIQEDEILNEEFKQRIFWFCYKRPIIINSDEFKSQKKQEVLNATLKWCKDIDKITFVLVGHQIDTASLSNMKIFQNFGNLVQFSKLYKKLEQKLKVYLRQEKSVLFKDLIKDDLSLNESVTTADLIQMLKGKFYVEETQKGSKKEFYVSRKVSKVLISNASLSLTQNNMFIISVHGSRRFSEVKENSSFQLFDKKCRYPENTSIIVANEELKKEEFDSICNKFPNRNIHYVRVIDKNYFQWITTRGSINQIRKHAVIKEFISESKIFSFCKNKINLICGLSGLGKTKLLRRLKENCRFDALTVFVNLTEHSSNFNEEHDVNECLASFLNIKEKNGFKQKLVKMFENKRKIIFFFDGFDELHYNQAKHAKEYIKEISQLGFTIWIAARDICKEDLETTFNTVSITIKPFSTQTEQEEYVEKKLGFQGKNANISNVKKLISTLNSKNQEILALPLHLSMVIDIYEETSLTDIEDFNISNLYRRFIEGRYQQFWKNQELPANDKISELIKRYYEDQYGKAALKTCLNQDLVEKLPVSFNDDYDAFLQNDKDPWGLFSALEGPAFIHQTYAELFAALWVSKNVKQSNLSLLKEIFDNFILKNSVMALQILFAKYSTSLEDYLKSADHNGKTPLHLAMTAGSTDTVSFFIEKGVNLNQFEDIHLLLQQLLSNGQTQMFKFLVENGVDIDGSYNGLGLLHVAIVLNNLEMVRFLIDKKININQECSASREEYKTVTAEMLGNGWERYMQVGKTALDLAVDYGQVSVVEILLKNDASCNKYQKENALQKAKQNAGGTINNTLFGFIGLFTGLIFSFIRTHYILIETRENTRAVDKPPKHQQRPPNHRKQKNYKLQQMPKQRKK